MPRAGKIARCPCELSVNPKCNCPKLIYTGPDNPKILVVLDQVDFQEDKSCKGASGYNAREIRRILRDNSVDLQQVGWTYAVCCYSEFKPKKHHIASCANTLVKTLKRKSKQLELVITVGKLPAKVLLQEPSINKARGKLRTVGDVKYMPVFSPKYVRQSKSDNKKRHLEMDIKKAIKFLENVGLDQITCIEVNAEQLRSMIPEIKQADKLTFDLETSSLDMYDPQQFVIGVGLCWKGQANEGVWLPLEHPELNITPSEYKARVQVLREVLATSVPKEAYNGEFDLKFLHMALGIEVDEVKNYCKDPIQAHHLIDTSYTPSLSQLVLEYCPDIAGYDSNVDELWSKHGSMVEFPLEEIGPYCVGDVIGTHRVGEILEDKLHEMGSYKLYNEIVVPAAQVYSLMSVRGIRLDVKEAKRLEKMYNERQEQLEKELLESEIAERWRSQKGKPLNLSSPAQMAELIYDICGLPEEKQKRKKKNGKVEWTRSFDSQARSSIIKKKGQTNYPNDVVEFVEKCEHLSQIATQSKMFTSRWREWVHEDGLVHPDYNNRFTESGRLSTTNPNVQQMPTRIKSNDPETRKWMQDNAVKRMFVSKWPEGYLVNVDYSQLELRLMAVLSQDDVMIATYRDGLNEGDIHRATARQKFSNFDVEPENVQSDLRTRAKTINFKGAYSFDKEFLEAYPGLAQWVESARKLALTQGGTKNILGRWRFEERVRSIEVPNKPLYAMNEQERENYFAREHFFRCLVNHLIQSLGHDILQTALLRVERRMRSERLVSHLNMEVHDSLVADCPTYEEALYVGKLMKEEMEAVGEEFDWCNIPLTADVEIGKNWWNKKEVEVA